MPRSARPSDIYRLPEHTRPPAETRSSLPPPPPRRKFPVWVGVAGVLAIALIVSGLVRGATDATPGNVPLVDVVSEDQAIAALRLYGAQATTTDELRRRAQIYSSPGPRDAAQVAARGAREVGQALTSARKIGNADPLFSAYVNHGDHPTIAKFLADMAQFANSIALLAATHDTLYSGSGAIPLEEASVRLRALTANGNTPAPLDAWATALLEQMEDRNRVQEASEARAATQQLWEVNIGSLDPAAVAELQAYLSGLPPVTINGLRGHPIAGPALRLLEEHSREVSQRVGGRAALEQLSAVSGEAAS